MKRPKKTVCYVSAYKDTLYPRSITLIEALKRSPNIDLRQATNKTKHFFRYFEAIFKVLYIRIRFKPDIYILGFRGHEIFWLMLLLTKGKKLVFDSLVSPYDSLRNENKQGLPGRCLAPLLYPLEKKILKYSAAILADTIAQKEFLANTFQIEPAKIFDVYVGGCEALPPQNITANKSLQEKLNVLFYGSFLPLHGIETILEAAFLLAQEKIQFTLIGGHRHYLPDFLHSKNLKTMSNIKLIKHVPFKHLLEKYIPAADICLGGPFGNTGQAQRVITTKTFQCLASGKPTIIGKNKLSHLFTDKKNCILVRQKNPEELAEAIRWGMEHRDLLSAIGRTGRDLYEKTFSIQKISKRLEETIL